MALDEKPGVRILILSSAVWAAEPSTIDSRRERLAGRVTKTSVSTRIYHKCQDPNTVTNRTYKTNRQKLFYRNEVPLTLVNQYNS